MTVAPIGIHALMRCDSVRNDGVGWVATFYGKPDVHDNHVTIPLTTDQAEQIKPGRQYLFEIREER